MAVIITGAGQGIGLAIAERLGRAGTGVVLNDLKESLLERALVQLRAENIRCAGVAGDAAAEPVIQQLIRTAVDNYGKIDTVILNAGITLFGPFLEYPASSFDEVLRVNLRGSFFLAQAAAKQMIRQGDGGSLLFMSSVTGHQAHRNLAAYGMTKAALEMLAKHLALELASHRITVNAVAPGATMTERTRSENDYERTWSEITPLGRPASTDDIAATAAFLVSHEARHITGQTLVVDGGWTSVSPQPE